MRLIRGNSGSIFVGLALVITGLFSSPIHAQPRVRGEFSLSQEVHWGSAVLPTGQYTYALDSEGGPASVQVVQKGGSFSGLFLVQSSSRTTFSEASRIILKRIGEDMFVASLQVGSLGAELKFPISTNSGEVRSPDSTVLSPNPASGSLAQEFFTILNPNHEDVSATKAQEVYLLVCKAVEERMNWSTTIRPRLVLHLGAEQNLLRLPDREIRLKKWDEYRFAEGVVELALRDLLSPEEKAKLSILAVDQASSSVNLCELKKCAN